MRKFYIAILLVACSATVMAQSGTKSPYSQFGLGVLADQSTGFNRGMNGIGYAMREHNQIDYLNPAAYSAIDSLSFIFDAGVGLQRNTFEEKGKKQSGNRATFDYAVAAFRVAKGLGVSYGLLPYTNVGYSYSSTSNVNKGTYEDGSNPTYTNSYSGDGGLHQVFVGAGWEPFRGLSVGFNASYLWGGYNRYVINSYSETYVNTLSRVYKASVHSYKLDFGLQYEARVSRKDRFTLGLVYSLGHKLGADAELRTDVADALVVRADTDLLSYLLECLIDATLQALVQQSPSAPACCTLVAQADGRFVRFALTNPAVALTSEQLHDLFSPRPDGIPYLLCKQIIREHDTFLGHPGCRINAEPATGGGHTVWFTLPAWPPT